MIDWTTFPALCGRCESGDIAALAEMVDLAAAETVRPEAGFRLPRAQNAHRRTIRILREALSGTVDAVRVECLRNCCTGWLGVTPHTASAIDLIAAELHRRAGTSLAFPKHPSVSCL